jgi:hypothetical protein
MTQAGRKTREPEKSGGARDCPMPPVRSTTGEVIAQKEDETVPASKVSVLVCLPPWRVNGVLPTRDFAGDGAERIC